MGWNAPEEKLKSAITMLTSVTVAEKEGSRVRMFGRRKL